MPNEIIVALIGAGATVIVAVITLVKQFLAERRADRAAELEKRQGSNEVLLSEYRQLLQEHRTDLTTERDDHAQTRRELEDEKADKRRLREDRDEWRRRAENCERLWDQLREAKERK